jgi:GNAT superfamily N-acetyltransferase
MEDLDHQYSEVESLRFQMNVHRFRYRQGPESEFIDQIERTDWDLAIVRVPTAELALVGQLFALPGARLCDCLVEFTRDNRRVGPPSAIQNAGFEIVDFAKSDLGLLDDMVGRIFASYENHYSRNPRLASFSLVDSYREWARGFVDVVDRRCLLATIDQIPAAIATVKTTEPTEGVLYGVLPEFQGRGLYHDLIRATVNDFVGAGSPLTVVSTQLENRAVQVVWIKEGFRPASSWYTVHLMR